jgi:hypothetical protein
MDPFSSFFTFFIFVFHHNHFLFCALLFGMEIGLEISCKSKLPFICKNFDTSTFHFLLHLSIQLHFVHLERLKMHSF